MSVRSRNSRNRRYSLHSHLRSCINNTLLISPTCHIALTLLLIKQLASLAHCKSDHLILTSLPTPSLTTTKHLQSLHRCSRPKTTGAEISAAAALLIELAVGLLHLIFVVIVIVIIVLAVLEERERGREHVIGARGAAMLLGCGENVVVVQVTVLWTRLLG